MSKNKEADLYLNLKCSGVDLGGHSHKKFAATYSECVQIGTDEFKQVKKTKVFLYGESFVNVMEWLESIGVKNPTLNSVDISEVDLS